MARRAPRPASCAQADGSNHGLKMRAERHEGGTWNKCEEVRLAWYRNGMASMKFRVLIAFVLNMGTGICFAETPEWRRYLIPSTGANVDIPVSIFTEDAGSPEGGIGRRFFTQDRRADLTIQSVPNPGNDSPAEFLQKRRPPVGIQYKRVTPTFLRCVQHSKWPNLVQSL